MQELECNTTDGHTQPLLQPSPLLGTDPAICLSDGAVLVE
jgi:hypothetical protein